MILLEAIGAFVLGYVLWRGFVALFPSNKESKIEVPGKSDDT